MKNSSMPAMPLTGDAYQDFAGYDDLLYSGYNPECQGLTKREHFAGLAMQGILVNSNYEAPRCKKLSGMAIDAVAAADFLLEELDK